MRHFAKAALDAGTDAELSGEADAVPVKVPSSTPEVATLDPLRSSPAVLPLSKSRIEVYSLFWARFDRMHSLPSRE